MRFQLPQFIETESKLIGPFTLKQFLWVAGGAIIIFLLFLLFQGLVFIFLAIPTAIVFLGLAFVKIEGEPLINYAAYGLSYLFSPKKYLFKPEEQPNAEINLNK